MHHNAFGRLFSYARHNRKHPTEAERKLWEKLSVKQTGFKFRRQHPIFSYIVDFYCVQLKYAIEVDGQIHLHPSKKLEDQGKDSTLTANGIFIHRFTNDEVLFDIKNVISQIHQRISQLSEDTQ